MKQKILVTVLSVAAVGGIVLGSTQVFAETPQDHRQSLIEKIATKFNLNKDDVQKVFDEERNEHQQEMQNRVKEKLDQAVKDGKINQTQQDALLAKLKELQEKRQEQRESLKNMTPEERRTQMQSQRQALEDWATQNGIDLETLLPHTGRGMMGHGPMTK